MKTVVLISGQMRSFEDTWPNQYWMFLRHLEDPHFFVSCADDAQAWSAELLKQRFRNVTIERVEQPTLPEPDWKLSFHAAFCPTPNNPTVIQKMLRDFWHRARVFQFALENGAANAETFVRLRPDLHFHRFDDIPSVGVDPTHAVTPYWGRYGGCNDRLAIVGAKAADAYFLASDAIPAMLESGCPLHPETLLGESIRSGGAALVHGLNTEFSTRRLPDARGMVEFVPPDIKVNEFMDLARR